MDPPLHVVWTRFRLTRPHVAFRPPEVPRFFCMLDLVAHGARGHGPVCFLFLSAAEIGFVGNGEQQGWIRAALCPLWMLTWPIQHFQSAIFEAWRGAEFLDIRGSLPGLVVFSGMFGCLVLVQALSVLPRAESLGQLAAGSFGDGVG